MSVRATRVGRLRIRGSRTRASAIASCVTGARHQRRSTPTPGRSISASRNDSGSRARRAADAARRQERRRHPHVVGDQRPVLAHRSRGGRARVRAEAYDRRNVLGGTFSEPFESARTGQATKLAGPPSARKMLPVTLITFAGSVVNRLSAIIPALAADVLVDEALLVGRQRRARVLRGGADGPSGPGSGTSRHRSRHDGERAAAWCLLARPSAPAGLSRDQGQARVSINRRAARSPKTSGAPATGCITVARTRRHRRPQLGSGAPTPRPLPCAKVSSNGRPGRASSGPSASIPTSPRLQPGVPWTATCARLQGDLARVDHEARSAGRRSSARRGRSSPRATRRGTRNRRRSCRRPRRRDAGDQREALVARRLTAPDELDARLLGEALPHRGWW